VGEEMAVLKKTPWLLIFFIIVGGLFGGVLGEVLKSLSPEGPLRDFFLKAYTLGLDPPFTLDLRLISLTLGMTFKLNLFSFLGILLGVYIYKQA
jgi:hypothetical protein